MTNNIKRTLLKLKIVYLGLFLIFNSASSLASNNGQDIRLVDFLNRKQEVELFIKKVRNQGELPGIAVSIFTSDTKLLQYTVGVKKLGETSKLTNADNMHLGSNTKAITGMIAGKLVEKGKVQWDVKLVDALPEIKDSIHLDYKNTTLLDFLTHTSGIASKTSMFWRECISEDKNIEPIKSRRLYTECITKKKPSKIERFQYSNAGFIVAASIMEAMTGESWEVLVSKEICHPLKLNCGFGWPASSSADQTFGHDSGFFSGYKPQDLEDYSLPLEFGPAGDMFMTINDYQKWIVEFLKGIKNQSKLANRETFQMLLYSGLGKKTPGIGWGSFVNKDGFTLSKQAGSAGPFYAKAVIIKELDIGFVILMNCSCGDEVKKIEKYILKILLKPKS